MKRKKQVRGVKWIMGRFFLFFIPLIPFVFTRGDGFSSTTDTDTALADTTLADTALTDTTLADTALTNMTLADTALTDRASADSAPTGPAPTVAESADATSREPFALTGILMDEAGNPVAEAFVSLCVSERPKSRYDSVRVAAVRTDASGRYTLTVPPAVLEKSRGSRYVWQLEAMKWEYVTRSAFFFRTENGKHGVFVDSYDEPRLDFDAPKEIAGDAAPTEILLWLARNKTPRPAPANGRLIGQIADTEGKPVPGANLFVEVESPEGKIKFRTQSSADGTFRIFLRRIVPEKILIRIRADGFRERLFFLKEEDFPRDGRLESLVLKRDALPVPIHTVRMDAAPLSDKNPPNTASGDVKNNVPNTASDTILRTAASDASPYFAALLTAALRGDGTAAADPLSVPPVDRTVVVTGSRSATCASSFSSAIMSRFSSVL